MSEYMKFVKRYQDFSIPLVAVMADSFKANNIQAACNIQQMAEKMQKTITEYIGFTPEVPRMDQDQWDEIKLKSQDNLAMIQEIGKRCDPQKIHSSVKKFEP